MKTTLPILFLALLAAPALAADPWAQFSSMYGESGRLAPVVAAASTAMGTEFNSVPISTVDVVAKPSPRSCGAPERDSWDRLHDWSGPRGEHVAIRPGRTATARGQHPKALHAMLAPYRQLIAEAAERFAIPVEVVGAVIMVESSGDRYAQATTSSAKGLMQTIDATFAEARRGLLQEGVRIADNPFDPRASILAGGWYLDRMFRQMEEDFGRRFSRSNLLAWRKAVEYYYVGPGHGRQPGRVVLVAAGGRTVAVDKSAYGQKVLSWVRKMGEMG